MFTICVSQRALCQRGPNQNQNESINNNESRFIISACERNEMRGHMEESHLRKIWYKCYCMTQMQAVQNNKREYKKRRQVLRQL